MIQENMELMEKLNEKCDAQSQAIVTNREMLDEKLSQFERGVTEELKAATAHLDLQAYEESFAKVEKDITVFYKELSQLREDYATQ